MIAERSNRDVEPLTSGSGLEIEFGVICINLVFETMRENMFAEEESVKRKANGWFWSQQG